MSETNGVILDMQKWGGVVAAIFAVGAAGGMTGWFMLADVGFIAMTFCAATVAGAVCMVGFGREGAAGWGLALLSALFATALSAFGLGVAFNLPRALNFIDAVFATLWFMPTAGILWLILMSFSHVAARHWRRMRNSDFLNG